MKYVSIIILLLSSFFLTAQTVIPAPETVVQGNGEFRTKNLQADIRQTTNTALPSEAYRLQVTENGIEIEASGDAGFFYARQTLKQLASDQNGTWIIPCLKIEDRPRVGFRSFLLDSGRQYQKVSTIKKYIDMAALLKMNYFHWHLTEGLGWRIEIKKYPRLTSIGSKRRESEIGTWNSGKSDGTPHEGFYTQEQIRDIVQYAARRNITIVPEIEMPGHASAAAVAYPFLSLKTPGEVPTTFIVNTAFDPTSEKLMPSCPMFWMKSRRSSPAESSTLAEMKCAMTSNGRVFRKLRNS